MNQGPTCTVNYLCIGALLVFVGSILLCTLGFTVILPYEATRLWPEVTCTVLNASYNRHVCTCQRHLTNYEPCSNKYPCLQVYVSFTPAAKWTSIADKIVAKVTYGDSLTSTDKRSLIRTPRKSGDNVSRTVSSKDESETTDIDLISVSGISATIPINRTQSMFIEAENETTQFPIHQNSSFDPLDAISSTETSPLEESSRVNSTNQTLLSTSPQMDDIQEPTAQITPSTTTVAYTASNDISYMEHNLIAHDTQTDLEDKNHIADEKTLTTLLYRSWADAFYEKVNALHA